MMSFVPVSADDAQTWFPAYVAGISIPYDDFLEDHILSSRFYRIEDGEVLGLVGIRDSMVTFFSVPDRWFHRADEAFEAALAEFGVTEAFVPTTDLGFLAVASARAKALSIHAFHFTATDRPVRSPEFGAEFFRLAQGSEVGAVIALAGDFLDRWEERIARGEIYLLEVKGERLGLGVLVPNRLMPGCIGTGMFTRPDCRGRGVGRSTILYLKNLVEERGLTPVPGCWVHNRESRLTLQSAGYISLSRLLHFRFWQEG